MQSEPGKLFIGGISWDTTEERVKEYFSAYGEVLEAVIMKDRITGRARGFGFVVFADPDVAETVIKVKHNIDGRMVEAKKAVPRDDQGSMSRTSNSIQGSPAQSRTRKIFVGGLASTVTENDFKNYFVQFGKITDVVVMYDQNTQRPRGFGFITYDSEDAVDKVLLKTFHELNGKMVEVKRAVPKELSPSPSRTPLVGGGYNYGLGRISNFINSYNQGYSPTVVGGYGRFNPLPGGRSGFPPIGSGVNFETGLSPNPYYGGNLNRIGFDGGNSSFFSSSPRNLWGNGALSSINSSGYMGSGSGAIGGGTFGNNGFNWSSSPISPQGRGFGSSAITNLGYGRSATSGAHMPSNGGHNGDFADFYGDPTWRLGNLEREEPGSFAYGLGGGASDFQVKSSPGYVGGYSVTKRQINRGIAG